MPEDKNARPASFKKRGGTRFPGIDLSKAEKYAKSLASKTHTGPQDAKIIMKGVFDAGGNTGDIRLSACRQFGFVKGANKALEATEAARDLCAATDEQRINILQQAFLTPPIFHKLYTAFQGDTRSNAELRQQAVKFGVHPENLDKCISCFIASGVHSKIIAVNGEKIQINKIGSINIVTNDNPDNGLEDYNEVSEQGQNEVGEQPINETDSNTPTSGGIQNSGSISVPRTNSNVTIDLKIDSSMDADKLAKMLGLLKENGLV